jgi:hypothetical protein
MVEIRRGSLRNIKRFIKYRGYPYLRMFIKNKAKIRVALLPITLAVGVLNSNFWVPFALHYLKIDSGSGQSLDIWVKILLGIMIIFSLIWVNRILLKKEKESTERTKAILKQWSLDSSEKNDITNNPKSAIYVNLDQRIKPGENRTEWIKRSLIKQKEAISDLIYVIEGTTHPIAHYEGLAHIPYVFLLGNQIGSSRDFQFLEWDELVKKKWVTLPQVVANYLLLPYTKKIVESVTTATDVTIRISLTNEIQNQHLKGLPAQNYNTYHFKLDTCGRHAIKCSQQLAEYKQHFRDLLDEINSNYHSLKRIHIFISAQTSLVFTFGSALTRNDCEFLVYNFEPNSVIPYKWALRVHKDYYNLPINELIRINS